MEHNAFEKFDLPFEIEKIPTASGGLYYFRIRFPTDYELGLTTGADREAVLENLAGRVDRYAKAYAFCELKGTLHDGKAEHMRTLLNIGGELVASSNPSFLLKTIAQSSKQIPIEEITRVLRFAFSAARPIYIGLCHDQSFYERINQHVAGRTGLIPFLKKCHMSIADLSVHCLSLKVRSRANLREYERLTQAIFRPAFSAC